MKPSRRIAPKGSTDHLERCAGTTSVWPRMAMGRAEPLPRMRATRLARAGSSDSSFTGMPSRSSTPARYLAAAVSLPGGLEVSMRRRAVKWRRVSAFSLREWMGAGWAASATAGKSADRARTSACATLLRAADLNLKCHPAGPVAPDVSRAVEIARQILDYAGIGVRPVQSTQEAVQHLLIAGRVQTECDSQVRGTTDQGGSIYIASRVEGHAPEGRAAIGAAREAVEH